MRQDSESYHGVEGSQHFCHRLRTPLYGRLGGRRDAGSIERTLVIQAGLLEVLGGTEDLAEPALDWVYTDNNNKKATQKEA